MRDPRRETYHAVAVALDALAEDLAAGHTQGLDGVAVRRAVLDELVEGHAGVARVGAHHAALRGGERIQVVGVGRIAVGAPSLGSLGGRVAGHGEGGARIAARRGDVALRQSLLGDQ